MRRLPDVVVLCAVAAVISAGPAWAQEEMSAVVSVERHVQSQGLFPAAGDYVQYDVTVTNSGQSEIAGQSLWVRLESEGGRTDSQASFSIPALAPGQSVQIYAGPFKTHEAGRHSLYLGINGLGSPEQDNEVALSVPLSVPADSFAVYSPAFAVALPVGAGLAAAGAAILVVFLFRRKR